MRRQYWFQASRRLNGGQEPQSSCPGNRLRPIVGVEFAVDITGVDLNRIQREEKLGCDFRIGQPFGEELEDFKLPFAQRLYDFGF